MEFGYPVISLSYCFSEYEGKSIDISNMDTSNIIDMTYMFSYCKNLTSLDVSNFDTSKVTDIVTMFKGSKLEFLICNSKLISNEARKGNSFTAVLVPETVKGVTFDAKIKIQRNMDLKLLQAKLKLTGLAGKTIGYKEV